MTQRWIYFFGNGHADGNGDFKHLIGGKGASLADMTRAGLNVPPGFTISTECCDYFYRNNQRWPDDLEAELRANLERLEKLAGRRFGVGGQPLLVAVRSGAAQSMPGMMDTVLNVGLNPDCVAAMAERTGNPRGAWEAYLHFIRMYAHTVGGIENDAIENCVQMFRAEHAGKSEDDLDADQTRIALRPPARFPCREDRRRIPDRSVGHALRQHQCRLRLVEHRAGHHLSQASQDRRPARHRRQRADDVPLGSLRRHVHRQPGEPGAEIIIESAYGLGEAIVLGKVTPDRFVLDKNTLALKESRDLAQGNARRHAGGGRPGPNRGDATPPRCRRRAGARPWPSSASVSRRISSHPCDIEWALSHGEFLSAASAGDQVQDGGGPASSPAEREKVRQEEIAALKAMAEPAGTVWSRFNLAEILPEPTPMTWAIVRQFMSGRGGFGQMYRDLGFDPDPALDDDRHVRPDLRPALLQPEP